MAFGKELYNILKKKNMTVKELSKLTDIPATTLYSLINRDTNTLNLNYVNRICNILGPSYTNELLSAANLTSFIDFNTKTKGVANALKPSSKPKLSYQNILSEEENLIRHYRGLNSKGKELLYRYSKDLFELSRYKQQKK